MTLYILSFISWTSLISQFFLVILYTLVVMFYKFNKSSQQGESEELNPFNTIESVEYFSDELINTQPKKDSDFENFDDYSAFSNGKNIEVNDSKLVDESFENEPEYSDQNPKIIEEIDPTEIIENSDEGYVHTNTTPTATVEEEDFEQTTFSLQQEQENSITMVDEEDIKRVFQSNDWAVRHQKTNH